MSNKPSLSLQPIVSLHKNSSEFFDRFYEKNSNHMSCSMGCSKCCFVDLTVFQAEAYHIIEWVNFLSLENKLTLLNDLKSSEMAEQKNTLGKVNKPCSFLRQGKCTIYDARPTICRTQGLALQYKISDEKNQIQLAVDHCPLNFKEENSLPNKAEWLDLDRLNALQSIAENFFLKNNLELRNQEIEKLINKKNRISLKKLKEFIVVQLEANGI
ncbi:YkgJ family cysteine cluster protein [Silvanigrella sp.]|jgi:Fe-S-cluster containining protein|uniref:YkgJ family cysteine cluster protein n=1 Tax=Silvanigrella sp. TaxID=2024976 RepID=UPI0037CC9FD2|nr:YkgJ family cysteine cluster protein [Silvanigrellaceae bacterium]